MDLEMLKIPEKYLHDRLILLLLTVNTFLTALASVLILFKIGGGQGDSYIVQYRANLGLSAFHAGGSGTFISFVLFALITFILSVVLSMRVYSFHRQFSVVILSLTVLLLILTIVISNALLVLR